jgi:hypothetical protein
VAGVFYWSESSFSGECTADRVPVRSQEEAEEEYNSMFPDHGKGFSDLAQAPQEWGAMDAEEAGQQTPQEVDTATGQSLVRGQMLGQVVALQQR